MEIRPANKEAHHISSKDIFCYHLAEELLSTMLSLKQSLNQFLSKELNKKRNKSCTRTNNILDNHKECTPTCNAGHNMGSAAIGQRFDLLLTQRFNLPRLKAAVRIT